MPVKTGRGDQKGAHKTAVLCNFKLIKDKSGPNRWKCSGLLGGNGCENLRERVALREWWRFGRIKKKKAGGNRDASELL